MNEKKFCTLKIVFYWKKISDAQIKTNDIVLLYDRASG